MAAAMWAASAGAQTQPAQTDPLKQTPEGRAAGVPTAPMNCSATMSRGDDGKTTTTSNCPAAQDKPVPSNAAQQFPYPGDTAPAAEPQKQEQSSGAPDAPASKRFPYPGEQDAQPSAPQPSSGAAGSSSSSSSGEAKPEDSGGLQDAGSSGSSSSSAEDGSSSSSSSSQGSAAPEGTPEDASGAKRANRSARKKLPPVPRLSPTQREVEDLQVAGFYQSDGNFTAAYARAKDAVSIAGDDPDAHLALAEAARRLGKLDEAEQNYKRCLELDPVPKTRKVAEKALKEMTGGA